MFPSYPAPSASFPGKFLLVAILSLSFLFHSCKPKYNKHQLEVTATAYTSHGWQTQGDPRVTAWGDTLKPGMKAIAVSRDLIGRGLTSGTEVQIEGMPGTYTVMDKMNRRWEKKIDVYMGQDLQKAREWGKKRVVIHWKTPVEEDSKKGGPEPESANQQESGSEPGS